MEDKTPLFTVVIPTRHRDDLLSLCLTQLAPGTQTLSKDKYEVFVTDDGSQSTSEALVRERFPWATWLAGPRRGPASNRNHGANHGTAPWLVFTDDDCNPSVDWLKAFADAIAADAKSGQVKNVYEGRTTCATGLTSPLQHAPVNETGGWLWSCNMAVERSIYHRIHGFDEEFPFAHMEDVDFRERLHGVGATMRFITEATVDHPPRPDNLCEKVAPTHESEFLMYYKTGETGDYRFRHLRRLASARIRKYLRYRSDPEAKILLRSLWVEAVYILKHASLWKQKYQARYKDEKTAYPPDIAERLQFR